MNTHKKSITKNLICIIAILFISVHSKAAEKIDVNKAIENPKLTAAIEEFSSGVTIISEANLTKELKKANYLTVLISKNGEKILKKDKKFFQKGEKFSLLSLKGEKGLYLAAFTDWNQVYALTKKYDETMVFPADQLWDFYENNLSGALVGIVINPAGKAIPLDRELIKSLSSE